MSEWQGMRASGVAKTWWRRKLHDGSFLSVIHEASANPQLPWAWRHRGPKFHPVLGTVINAEGRCSSAQGAKDAADRHAATLPYQPSRQQELPTAMDDRR